MVLPSEDVTEMDLQIGTTTCPIVTAKAKEWFKKTTRKTCSKKFLNKRLPITEWLPKYTWDTLLKDAIAGFTVGLTAIPQGIAYAVVAGLEPQYGLYSGFMGCFVYIILGSCKDVTIGPTAITAIMVQKHVETLGVDFSILVTFLAGLIIFGMGVLQLGFLVEFISFPVTAGFTSAAAITIGSSQVKSIFGLPGTRNDFLPAWQNIFENITSIKLWDSILGIVTIIILLILRKFKEIGGRAGPLWRGLSLSRNALAVIGGTTLAWALSQGGHEPFALTGKVGEGLPKFNLPPFSTTVDNKTLTFVEMADKLGSSLATIPLVAVLESIAIAKSFSKGRALDATQEMLALGACNILGSFFGSMPTTGSFTRTVVNNASGVVTTFGGIFTGVMILMACGFLTSTFYYIPKATLAAVIVSAMIFMLEFDSVKLLWNTKKLDLVPFVVTLLACLIFSLEIGIIVGIVTNLAFVLYFTSRPKVNYTILKMNGQNCILITPDQSLVFSAAEYVRSRILKTSVVEEDLVVIIDGVHIRQVDATVARSFKVLIEDFTIINREVLFWNWCQGAADVIIKMEPKTKVMFRNSRSVEELMEKHDEMNSVITR